MEGGPSPVGVFTVSLPRDAPGRRMFGDRSPDLELEGKRKDIRHKFRQVRAARSRYPALLYIVQEVGY